MQIKKSNFIYENISKIGINYLNFIKFNNNLEDLISISILVVKTDFMNDPKKIPKMII